MNFNMITYEDFLFCFLASLEEGCYFTQKSHYVISRPLARDDSNTSIAFSNLHSGCVFILASAKNQYSTFAPFYQFMFKHVLNPHYVYIVLVE